MHNGKLIKTLVRKHRWMTPAWRLRYAVNLTINLPEGVQITTDRHQPAGSAGGDTCGQRETSTGTIVPFAGRTEPADNWLADVHGRGGRVSCDLCRRSSRCHRYTNYSPVASQHDLQPAGPARALPAGAGQHGHGQLERGSASRRQRLMSWVAAGGSGDAYSDGRVRCRRMNTKGIDHGKILAIDASSMEHSSEVLQR